MYLNESLNEVLGKLRLGVLFRSEVLEYVCELLPEVECLLESSISMPFNSSRSSYPASYLHISLLAPLPETPGDC